MPPLIMPTKTDIGVRRPYAIACFVLVAWILGGPFDALGQEPEWWGITVPDLNRTYRQPNTDLGPQQVGPLTLHLSSPDNELTVIGHRARLKPLDDGTHEARLRVELEGRGTLLAVMEGGESPRRFEDELEVPRQEIALEGRIGLERTSNGFQVIIHELPPSVRVRFRSRLGSQVTELCEQVAVLFLGAANCSGIEEMFSAADAPLPEPGTTYLLTEQHLGSEGLTLLDIYMSRQLDRHEGSIR